MTTEKKSSLSETDVRTLDVRLSFPALDKKKPNGPGSDKSSFQATLLLPPGTDLAPYKAAIKAAILKKWGKLEVKGMRPVPMHKAETKDYAGYEAGWLYVPTKTDTPVPLVDRQRIAVDPSKFFAGCWVRAHIRCYAYDNQFGKGVSFELKALQFIKDGDRLDGRGKPSNPDEVFEALEMEDTTPTGGDDLPWDPLA